MQKMDNSYKRLARVGSGRWRAPRLERRAELEEGGEGWRSAGEVAGGGRGGGDVSGRRGADAEWECGSTVRLCPRFFSHLYWVRGPRLISLRGLLRPGALVAWLRGSPDGDRGQGPVERSQPRLTRRGLVLAR